MSVIHYMGALIRVPFEINFIGNDVSQVLDSSVIHCY